MLSAAKGVTTKLPATPWGFLPPRMRVLFITSAQRTGGWLAEAFAADSASEVLLEEAVGMPAGLSRLREEAFDAVLVSHDNHGLNAFDLLDAIRTGSSDEQPIVVLGHAAEQEMAPLCYEAGADAYACVNSATTRSLIWGVARAIERHQLISDNRRLQQSQKYRLEQEHEEALRLLDQQRAMLADLEQIRRAAHRDARPLECEPAVTGSVQPGVPGPALPPSVVNHYRELLRVYVIMGSGSLSGEMAKLAELLAEASVTAHQVMMLHVFVLEEMVGGLGSRSARHVMNRADMLILEVMIHLAQGYRQRHLERVHPPVQQWLPGFAPRAA